MEMKGCGAMVGPFECCTIVCGDAVDLLGKLPDGSVGAVITDPPYGVEAEKWDGRVPYELLNDFRRLTRGPIVWFGAAPMIMEAARAFTPSPERLLIWAPNFTLSHTASNGIAYRYHPIYAWQLPKKHGGPTWDVLTANTECGNWWTHSCTKPLTLMVELCGLSPEDSIVLDPFAGSGSTLLAASALQRHFLGFEINPEYVRMTEARLCGEEIWKEARQICLFN